MDTYFSNLINFAVWIIQVLRVLNPHRRNLAFREQTLACVLQTLECTLIKHNTNVAYDEWVNRIDF